MIHEADRARLVAIGNRHARDIIARQTSYGTDCVSALHAVAHGLCDELPPIMLDAFIGEAIAVRLAKLKEAHGQLWLETFEQIGTALDRARNVVDHLPARGRKRKPEPTDEALAEGLRKRFALDRPKPPVNVIPIERARSARKGPYGKR